MRLNWKRTGTRVRSKAISIYLSHLVPCLTLSMVAGCSSGTGLSASLGPAGPILQSDGYRGKDVQGSAKQVYLAIRRTGKIPPILVAVGSGAVKIYTQKGHLLIYQFYSLGGSDVALDDKADIYVAGTCPSSGPAIPGIAVYAPPWNIVTRCLATPSLSEAIGVALNGKGYVAAMVYNTDAAGDVEIFPPGSTTGCVAVTGASFATLAGYGSFDSAGNLYVTANSAVGVVKGLCKASMISNLGLSKLSNASGIKVDSLGNIDVLVTPSSINIYKPGSKSPEKVVGLQSIGPDFVFTGKNIWGAGALAMYEYRFPAGGAPILPGIYTTAGTSSVAAFPVVTPGP